MSDIPTLLDEPIGIVREISEHALKRWVERTQTRSDIRALNTLKKHLVRSQEVELAPQYQAKALLNHDLEPARYLRCDTWIFVVSMDGVLKTVHAGSAKRWVVPDQKSGGRRSGVRRSR